MWVMGTPTMDGALERVRQWNLIDILPKITQPTADYARRERPSDPS